MTTLTASSRQRSAFLSPLVALAVFVCLGMGECGTPGPAARDAGPASDAGASGECAGVAPGIADLTMSPMCGNASGTPWGGQVRLLGIKVTEVADVQFSGPEGPISAMIRILEGSRCEAIVTVPAAAVTGAVFVRYLDGTSESLGQFTVPSADGTPFVFPEIEPRIYSLHDGVLAPGESVNITGQHISSVLGLIFQNVETTRIQYARLPLPEGQVGYEERVETRVPSRNALGDSSSGLLWARTWRCGIVGPIAPYALAL